MHTVSSKGFTVSQNNNFDLQDELEYYRNDMSSPSLPPMPSWRFSRRTLITACLTGLGFAIIATYTFHSHGLPRSSIDSASRGMRKFGKSDSSQAALWQPADSSQDSYCSQFRDPGHIAMIVKTGATELHAKVPSILDNALRCVRDPIIISDLDQKLGPHQVHDALARMSPADTKFNPEFDLYHKQKEYVRTGKEDRIPELKNMPLSSHAFGANRKAAWALDCYKFLYMVEMAWEIQPGKDWYFFMDADTYVNWPNLLRWLPQMDHNKMLYVGHPITEIHYPSELTLYFAHGGAGFLLSGATVEAFTNRTYSIAKEWEPRLEKIMYGDAVLGTALAEELDVYLSDGQLSMTENEPFNVAFEKSRWCRPLITMHHIKTEWQLLSDFDASHTGAATFRDLFHFIYPEGPKNFPTDRDDWDNQVRDDGTWDWGTMLDVATSTPDRTCPAKLREKEEHKYDPHCSFDACKLACEKNDKCMQFQFKTAKARDGWKLTTTCSHSDAFRMGRSRRVEVDWFDEVKPEVGWKWQSGWMVDRIAKKIEEMGDCADKKLIWPVVG